jgi:hypothetical protein
MSISEVPKPLLLSPCLLSSLAFSSIASSSLLISSNTSCSVTSSLPFLIAAVLFDGRPYCPKAFKGIDTERD